MEKRLEEIQGKKQVLEKVLNEKNARANTLQEEVYVLKERLANAQGTYKREMETEKQKVCVKGFIQSRKFLSSNKKSLNCRSVTFFQFSYSWASSFCK